VAALTPFLAHAGQISMSGGGGILVMRQAVNASAPALLAVLCAAGIAGVAGNLIQHGFLWSPGKLAPDFQRLSIGAGFKRLFGIDSFVQFLKTLLKVACVGA
jgi:flagellar biosynthetic protein FlhB